MSLNVAAKGHIPKFCSQKSSVKISAQTGYSLCDLTVHIPCRGITSIILEEFVFLQAYRFA
jgi:hypothetical protein